MFEASLTLAGAGLDYPALRVERLKFEGSDASQAQDTLHVVSRNLGNLNVQQSAMRRTEWAWHSAQRLYLSPEPPRVRSRHGS